MVHGLIANVGAPKANYLCNYFRSIPTYMTTVCQHYRQTDEQRVRQHLHRIPCSALNILKDKNLSIICHTITGKRKVWA